MNDNFHNTGFDPLQTLLQCENNIQQMALAINDGSDIVQELGKNYLEHQRAIQHLMFQNKKLQSQIDALNIKLTKTTNQVDLLKIQHSQP